MEEFELYRFNHHDGSSKDWAIRDNRNGAFTTRWGKTGPRLTQENQCFEALSLLEFSGSDSTLSAAWACVVPMLD